MRRSRTAVVAALLVVAAGCSPKRQAAPTTSGTPSPTASPTASSTASSASPSPSAVPATGSPTSSPAALPPAPAHFAPHDLSFVGPHVGWALGTACGGSHCEVAIAKTTDSGATWHQSLAPGGVWFDGDEDPWVTHMQWGNLSNGWLYGDAQYVTHDGGTTWKPLRLPGTVIAFDETQGTAWALVKRCTITTCTFTVWVTPQSSDAWVKRATLDLTDGGTVSLVRASASRAWVVAVAANGSGAILRTSDAGYHWSDVPDPCQGFSPDQVLARVDPANLWLACGHDAGAGHQRKSLYHSSDGGSHWGSQNTLPTTGSLVDLAAVSTSVAVMSTTRSGLLRTADGGITWTVVAPDCCDAGFGHVEFIDGVHGWTLGAPGAIWRTADRGRHWARYAFPA